ncbi:CMTR2.2 family protein [Megaselia abdita]
MSETKPNNEDWKTVKSSRAGQNKNVNNKTEKVKKASDSNPDQKLPLSKNPRGNRQRPAPAGPRTPNNRNNAGKGKIPERSKGKEPKENKSEGQGVSNVPRKQEQNRTVKVIQENRSIPKNFLIQETPNAVNPMSPGDNQTKFNPFRQPRQFEDRTNSNYRGPQNNRSWSEQGNARDLPQRRLTQNLPQNINYEENRFIPKNFLIQETPNAVNPMSHGENQTKFNPFRQPRQWEDRTSSNYRGPQNYRSWTEQGGLPQRRPPNQEYRGRPQNSNRITEEAMQSLFNIKRRFEKNPKWTLPNVSKAYSSQPYEFDHFQEQKNEMNRVKDGILENYPQEKWKDISDKFGLTPSIVRVLKFNMKLGYVVRNFPKAYELFSTYPLIPSGKLNSIHVGDIHGGMIIALNHYLHSNFEPEEIKWSWKATSQNPYYEDGLTCHRLDDRLLSKTYKNWSFGVDFSGDMIDKENIDFFVKNCSEFNEVHLAIVNYTIGTKLDPHNKEQLIFDHHFSGLVAALKLLSKNGSLIMISFSMFNAVNVSLLYFLNLVFETVHLHKPLTAPMTSFEFYIVALKFKKDALVEQYLEEMVKRVGPNSWEAGPLFPKNDIPKDYLTQHEEHLKYLQETFIINMKKFKFYNENPEDAHTKRWKITVRLMPDKFIRKFNIENIASDKKLIPPRINNALCAKMSKLIVDNTFSRNENCYLTTADLQAFDDQETCDQLLIIFEKFQNTQDLLSWPYDTENKTITNLPHIDMVLEYGKPIERVRKSMFITPENLYGLVAKIEEKYDIFVVEHFPEDNIFCTFDDQNKTVIKYEFKSNYGQSEREFLVNVFEKWNELRPNKMIFQNFMFLTHFSVSVLRIMASFYKFMSANLKGTIELEHFKKDLIDSKYIQDFLKELNGTSCDYIMCFAEFEHVNKGDFFEVITNYNSQLIMQYIVKAFDYLIAKTL